MVGVSYHELTAQTAKDEQYKAGQRKQFLVICVIGFAIAANSFINAGLFETVMIDNDGIYPGGQFVYKLLEDRYVCFILCSVCFMFVFITSC